MNSIHPQAIVEDGVTLGDGVEIGPFAIVQSGARLGAGCVAQAHAVIEGCVTMGERNKVGYGAIIGAPPQDKAFDPASHTGVTIGDDNILREYTTIHRGTDEGTFTTVGDDNFLMAGAHLGHNVQLGSHVVIANNCLLAGHVHVEDHVFLGGGSVFHQFIRIGCYSMARGGSKYSKDIPPYVMAFDEDQTVGLNSVGLRRNGFEPGERKQLKEAFKLIYASGLNAGQAIEKARADHPDWGVHATHFINFIANAQKRGFARLARGR